MAQLEDSGSGQAMPGNLTRRDFLWLSTLAGVALAPGIVLLSGCASEQKGSSAAAGEELPVAEYELIVSSRDDAPDGRKRSVYCYNGQVPGPPIVAKVGQKLRIKVINQLAVPTSVHWHGMHQPGTWQMDGVDQVSHAPIAPGASFTYEFTATPAGTHWYHSHVGVQYGNGLFGPLVIEEETPPAQYDRQETLLINDWFLKPAEEILAGLVGSTPMRQEKPAAGMKPGETDKGMADMPEMKPKPMPMGMGHMHGMMGMGGMHGMGGGADIGDVPFESALINGRGRFPGTHGPLTTLQVRPGERLRLRLINASSTYAFRFQIDGHRLTVIASDGAAIVPIEVDNLVMSPGERYDVVLVADQSGSAWVRAVTLAGDESLAVLRYPDAPEGEPASMAAAWGKAMLMVQQMRSPSTVRLPAHSRQVDLKLGGSMSPYVWTINGQAYPHADPIAAAQGEWLRFVIDNPTGMDHPFHLHGHYFYVLGSPDRLNKVDPPLKDTVNVPARSQMVILWQANNPGHWFFHCHIDWHLATGMARVIEIAAT